MPLGYVPGGIRLLYAFVPLCLSSLSVANFLSFSEISVISVKKFSFLSLESV